MPCFKVLIVCLAHGVAEWTSQELLSFTIMSSSLQKNALSDIYLSLVPSLSQWRGQSSGPDQTTVVGPFQPNCPSRAHFTFDVLPFGAAITVCRTAFPSRRRSSAAPCRELTGHGTAQRSSLRKQHLQQLFHFLATSALPVSLTNTETFAPTSSTALILKTALITAPQTLLLRIAFSSRYRRLILT